MDSVDLVSWVVLAQGKMWSICSCLLREWTWWSIRLYCKCGIRELSQLCGLPLAGRRIDLSGVKFVMGILWYMVTGDLRNGAWNVLLMDSVGCWGKHGKNFLVYIIVRLSQLWGLLINFVDRGLTVSGDEAGMVSVVIKVQGCEGSLFIRLSGVAGVKWWLVEWVWPGVNPARSSCSPSETGERDEWCSVSK